LRLVVRDSPLTLMHLDLASWLNLVSTVAIVGALIFTGLQVRAANLTRRDQASLELIRTALSENSARALELFGRLPENAPASAIEQMSPEAKLDMFEFGIRFEMIGYMVYRHQLDLQTVDDLTGGTILGYWSRAKDWAEQHRARTGHDEFLEWCEWLSLQLAKRRGTRLYVPAYKQHANWRG
jgi:hypothetical protein